MFSQKARCGSVGASRAGNLEEGGSSRVGGKVCLLVEMWDWAMWDWGWEIGNTVHHFFHHFFLHQKKWDKKEKKNYGQRPYFLDWKSIDFMVFDHKFNEPWPTKKNFFDPKKKFFWPQFLKKKFLDYSCKKS